MALRSPTHQEDTATQCAATELKRRQNMPALNWSQRVTMRMISDGRSPSGGSSYLDPTGLGIPGGTIRALNRRGLIERYSWTEPGWVLTKTGVDAINSGACDSPQLGCPRTPPEPTYTHQESLQRQARGSPTGHAGV